MDSTSQLEQLLPSQAQKEITANGLFDAMSSAASYGRHAEACAGLTWGYYGARYGGTLVPNGSFACGSNATTYMVADAVTGDVSFEPTPTLWNDAVGSCRCYAITSNTSAIVSWQDHRFGPGGLYGRSSAATGATSSQNAHAVLAGPVSGAAAAPTFRVLAGSDLPRLVITTVTAGYTLTLADANAAWVDVNSASAVIVSVPNTSAAAFVPGSSILINRLGTGALTISAASGVTVRTASSLTARAQHSTIGLFMRAANDWTLFGDLT